MYLCYIEYTNLSVYNTTIYFIYIKYNFDLHWVILRPSKKTDSRFFKENRSKITFSKKTDPR